MPDTLEKETPAPAPPAGDRTGFRLAVFGAVLVVTLFAGYGLGRLTGGPSPGRDGASPVTGMPGMTMPMDESQPHIHNADGTVTMGGGATAGGLTAGAQGAAVGGLSLSGSALMLVPADTVFRAGRKAPLRFRIAGPGGAPITTYAVMHDKPLHLIVVRRDLGGYQHLHPAMAADGTWTVDLTLAAPGSYRAIADFTAVVGGRQVAATLGADLTVGGNYAPVPLPGPVQRVTTDGLAVGYDGTPRTESTQPLLMTVTGPGGGAAGLEPYLGAYGHLVLLRQGDVGYVHVHPEPWLIDGKVKFWVAAPSAGTYRMFFDFQVGGRVHTAEWTVTVA
jgi:hypothetical protein